MGQPRAMAEDRMNVIESCCLTGGVCFRESKKVSGKAAWLELRAHVRCGLGETSEFDREVIEGVRRLIVACLNELAPHWKWLA